MPAEAGGWELGWKTDAKLYMEESEVTRQEFGSMLEKEGKAVYTFCRQLTGSRDDADELYQETMLIAMEKCNKIDEKGNPKSFEAAQVKA